MKELKPIRAESLPKASEPLALFDSHNHLIAPHFDRDREEVLEHAAAAGVTNQLCVGAGYGMDGIEAAIALANSRDGICAAVGVHPHQAELWSSATEERLRQLVSAHPASIKAIGETGLDYHYDSQPRQLQQQVFAAQLEFAGSVGLPFVVHTRDAHEDTLTILSAQRKHIRTIGGVIHCFSEDLAAMRSYTELGLYISVAGVVTFKKSENLRRVVKEVPRERLLIETDSPYLTAEPKRGRRNEPATLLWTAQQVADLLEIPLAELTHLTCENAKRLFQV